MRLRTSNAQSLRSSAKHIPTDVLYVYSSILVADIFNCRISVHVREMPKREVVSNCALVSADIYEHVTVGCTEYLSNGLLEFKVLDSRMAQCNIYESSSHLEERKLTL